jgi:uncharacterized protein YdiU (UPF0061 family)
MTIHVNFENTYACLPERFYARVRPAAMPAPRLVRLNKALAHHLGLDAEWLASREGVSMLAGNTIPEGAEPIALAYAGHQFGYFVPQLGDGRAMLLGEVVDRDGIRRDIQLKGSGRTPFSRAGDGRAVLGPVLREYVVSEAMAAMGIPTTRALAAVMTGETVMREKELPGAVLTRVAASHIRIGTFQYFAARGDREALRVLLDHVIARHYPEAAGAEKPALTVLEQVVARQAKLIARWLLVGFIHGVMNTDNMSIAGETIDYGPCAFMDAYDPRAVFSAIDEHGRYAYRDQPGIALWNLSRLAETLLPFLSPDENEAVEIARQVLSAFPNQFEANFHRRIRRKIGLLEERPDDIVLAGDLLNAMAANQADFTLTFRRLADAAASPSAEEPVRALFVDPTAYDAWAARWRERLAEEPQEPEARRAAMRLVNPAFIPRNHQVEAVIQAATEHGNFAPFHDLVTVLSRPYDDQPGFARYAASPQPHERVERTFCGT